MNLELKIDSLRRIILQVIILFSITPAAKGAGSDEEARPVTGIYGLEIGRMSAYSTYLSPLTYTGETYGVFGDWRKAMPFSPDNAVMDFDTEMTMGNMLNPPVTARMIDLNIRLGWGMSWRKRMPQNFQLTAGGVAAIDMGMLWLPRNGNNPVAARIFPHIGLKAGATWHGRIGRLPFLVSEEASLPLIGAFFSPAYGETYYEIYLGNHDGLAHFGWPGNHFSFQNHISIILDFGRTAMQVGYRFGADTSWVNNINTHIFRHFFTIGVIPGGMGIKGKRHVNTAWY